MVMSDQRSSPKRREALGLSTAMAALGLAGVPGARTTFGAAAQPEPAKPAAVTPAKAEDVRSIEAIIAALYDAISGPPGGRDWYRILSLFHPGARLIPCFATPQD